MTLFDTGTDIQPVGNDGRIYDIIKGAHGVRQAISIKTIHGITGLSERVVKEAVASLIVGYHARIGAIRYGDAPGYFMIESAADLEAAVKPLKGQIIAMAARLRIISGDAHVREFLGQMLLEGGSNGKA